MDTSSLFRRLRIAACSLTMLCLVPLAAGAQQPVAPYALGRGYPLGSSGVRLGGYIAVEWEDPSSEDASFNFDDLSLFVFGDIGSRIRFFTEIEDSEFLHITHEGTQVDHHADLERLYVDYLHRDAFKIRVGKFLTPVGTWNEIHPDPLTWTVTRPLASYATFPTFTTGLQAFGMLEAGNGEVEYAVFGQANPCLDCNTNTVETERLIGARLRWRLDALEIGVPALSYRDRITRDEVRMTGADLLARHGPLEIRAEATVAAVRGADSQTHTLEHAHYLQALYALTDRHMLVAREERARSRDGEEWTAWSIGGLYRPKSAMSLKLEYQHRTGSFAIAGERDGRRVLSSFGVLF